MIAAPLVSAQVRLRVDALGHVLSSRGDERASSHATHKLALGAFALAAALDGSAPFEEPLRALGAAAAGDGLVKAVLGAIPDADAATVRTHPCHPWQPWLPGCFMVVRGWAVTQQLRSSETHTRLFLASITGGVVPGQLWLGHVLKLPVGLSNHSWVVTMSGCLHIVLACQRAPAACTYYSSHPIGISILWSQPNQARWARRACRRARSWASSGLMWRRRPRA